ncbi:2'-5' RNA ligase family protein [Rhizobium sp. FKY42]|uniref:2'-5' RNA ligase family protein n=1 Tax=Rhizobium sp. FKY42 TaxID=2562310 RepID=UPI0010C0E304|nr:2'-5' RNA ligase family protein [Rhizobium sp. FKY42]
MNEWHSIWLMPAADDLAFFQSIVEDLSGRLGTEAFCPHLTLMEDMPRSRDDLATVLSRHFTGQKSFEATINRVDGLPLFFRSLFAGFEAAGPLIDLKTLAVKAFERGDVESFMPHVSLAYGVTEEQKAQPIADLSARLTDKVIRFTEVAVTASAQSIPIKDWQIVHRHALI